MISLCQHCARKWIFPTPLPSSAFLVVVDPCSAVAGVHGTAALTQRGRGRRFLPAIFRKAGDRHAEGISLGSLGEAFCGARRFDEAITACQDAAAICRETGDRHAEGSALDSLGIALREAERYEEAICAHQDAAVIYRDTGDRHGEKTALEHLASVEAVRDA